MGEYSKYSSWNELLYNVFSIPFIWQVDECFYCQLSSSEKGLSGDPDLCDASAVLYQWSC